MSSIYDVLKRKVQHVLSICCKNLYMPIIIIVLFSSCSKDEFSYVNKMNSSLPDDTSQIVPYFINNKLPVGKRQLKVLAIGNSYTIDGVSYLQELIDSANIDRNTYSVYSLTKGGKSLQYWSEQSVNEEVFTLKLEAGKDYVESTEGTVRKLLSQDWDVIVLQQVSTSSVNYLSYNPYLRQLIDCIRLNCTNPKVVMAWQMVHSYWVGYDSSANKPKGLDRWKLNVTATRCMTLYDGIDVVIPTGTAIQNARNTNVLQTNHDITRDGTHLAYGIGRYVASCTWFQTLFSPVYNMDVTGVSCTHKINRNEHDKTAMYDDSAVSVDSTNMRLCQKCAFEACLNPYEICMSIN